jgi:hypothetical protein
MRCLFQSPLGPQSAVSATRGQADQPPALGPFRPRSALSIAPSSVWLRRLDTDGVPLFGRIPVAENDPRAAQPEISCGRGSQPFAIGACPQQPYRSEQDAGLGLT